MPGKPSDKEEEYFARLETERRRKLEQEQQSGEQESQRAREKALHFMRCPKCGAQLAETPIGDVRVDKCTNCEGIWLDKGELEGFRSKEAGFLSKLFGGGE